MRLPLPLRAPLVAAGALVGAWSGVLLLGLASEVPALDAKTGALSGFVFGFDALPVAWLTAMALGTVAGGTLVTRVWDRYSS